MLTKPARLVSLDVVRGIAIVIMVATHIWTSFFWNDGNTLGTVGSYIGSFLSFALFLVVSGFILGNRHRKLSLKRIIIRSVLLITLYYVLGAIGTIMQQKDIHALFTTPMLLEEYLLPLAIFPPLAYIFVAISRRIDFFKRLLLHSVGSFFVLLGGLLLVVLGRYLGTQNTNFYLSLIVGAATYHTFPILSYLVMYVMGVWLGWSYKLESSKHYGAEVMVTLLIATTTAFVSYSVEHISFSLQNLDSIRWPPTLFFISAGLAVATLILYTATLLEERYKNIIAQTFRFLGKNALVIFVLHLLFIYTVQGIVLAKVPGITVTTQTPTPTPTPISDVDRIYDLLTTTYAQKEDWPFNGYKIAVIDIDPIIIKPGPAYIEVKPKDLGAFPTGADITVYALTEEQAIKKISGKVVSIGNNHLSYELTMESGFTQIFVAFSETALTQPIQTAQHLVTKPGKTSGTKLATISKDFKTWAYKPFAMYGQKWFVKNSKTIGGKHTFTMTLPISCEDLETYQAESNSQLTVKRDKTNVAVSGNCSALIASPQIPTTYTQAQSTINIPLDLDMKKQSNGKKSLNYTLSLTSGDKAPLVFAYQKSVAVSEPIYVAWTFDWEGFYFGSQYLKDITTLREKVPGVRVTHLFNPRLWNSSSVTKGSSDAQIAFVKSGISKYKDDLGMHMHLYTDMVTKAEVELNTGQGWNNRTDGYDIPFSAYAYEDALKILQWGIAEFPKKGLTKPTSFRAGGWMMDKDNLKALAAAGIKIDTSGRTTFSTGTFASGGKNYPGPWKLAATTQPYWVSTTDQNRGTTKANSVGVYEMPNNGGDSWAFSVEALLTRFKSNYTDVPTRHKLVTYITHPDFFYKEGPKMTEVLQTIYTLSADNDNGPVVFTTLDDYYQIYAK